MLDSTSLPDMGLVASRRTNGLREQPGNRDLLLTEAHHRMRNTLTLLMAWLRLDFAPAKLADLSEAIDRFEGRILAFGELYRLLSVGAGSGEISVEDYFESLCRSLTVAILEPKGLRCEVRIEEGFLAAKRCERLGLIIAELVTNAAKHAFPNEQTMRERGLVRVDAVYRDGCWCCSVSDNGIGSVGSFDGCGGRVLEDLAESIGARLIVESDCRGTTVTVVVPNRE
jgi:two-component sensor histidine kinase